MDNRFTEESKALFEFYNNIYIICPSCKQQGIILKKNTDVSDEEEILTCKNCGYLREGKNLYFSSMDISLFLRTNCCGNTLWALNLEHIEYLEKYISSKLRERKKTKDGWSNRSIESRIPRWIKDSKNRKEVLVGLKKLKLMIED